MTRRQALPLHKGIEDLLASHGQPLSATDIARMLGTNGRRVQPLVVEQHLVSHAELFVRVKNKRWMLVADQPSRPRTVRVAEKKAPSAPRGRSQGRKHSPPSKPRTAWTDLVPGLFRWQREALQAWEENGRRGIVHAVTGAGKTAAAKREVELMPSLVAMLRQHKEQAFSAARARPDDFVFASEVGTPLGFRNVVRRGLGEALKRAKIDRPIRWHDLRHCYASLLIAQGANVGYVSRQLGHSSARITLDVYQHEFDRAEHAQQARDAMEAGFGHLLR